MADTIQQLPESAIISQGNWGFEIVDHHVKDSGMFDAFLSLIKYGSPADWNSAVIQMKSKGVYFKAALHYCIYELATDYNKFAWLLAHYFGFKDLRIMLKFSKSQTGRKAVTRLLDIVKICKDWDDFYRNMTRNNDPWCELIAHINTEWDKFENDSGETSSEKNDEI